MERSVEKVVELVNRWAEYETIHPDAAIADFCAHYLIGQRRKPTPTMSIEEVANSPESETDGGNEQWSPEARLGALIGRLARYANLYAKKAMLPFEFKSLDEPIYLLALLELGTPKKSELIYAMLSEFPSGIDIINRLIGMGLMEEFPDEHDRRSKRLRITQSGIAKVQACSPALDQVLQVAFGTLSELEKVLLVRVLDRLDAYHNEHFGEVRNADFAEVYERLGKH